MLTVRSRSGISIRLTDERRQHIVRQHGGLAGEQALMLDVVSDPDRILEGKAGEHLAVREIALGKWPVVVYREEVDDGFLIIAHITRRDRSLAQRRQLWP